MLGLRLSLAVAGLAAATLAAAAAASTYDGPWTVQILTEKGDCDRAYRYPVQVTNGTVTYRGTASGFTVSGRVRANGAVHVEVARGKDSASGSGRITANRAAGTWIGRGCSGVWRAERE